MHGTCTKPKDKMKTIIFKENEKEKEGVKRRGQKTREEEEDPKTR